VGHCLDARAAADDTARSRRASRSGPHRRCPDARSWPRSRSDAPRGHPSGPHLSPLAKVWRLPVVVVKPSSSASGSPAGSSVPGLVRTNSSFGGHSRYTPPRPSSRLVRMEAWSQKHGSTVEASVVSRCLRGSPRGLQLRGEVHARFRVGVVFPPPRDGRADRWSWRSAGGCRLPMRTRAPGILAGMAKEAAAFVAGMGARPGFSLLNGSERRRPA
jgi:hypothetical protein